MKLLDFYAEWCHPCKVMNPIIDSLSEEFDIEKIDVDKNSDMVEKYQIMSIPTYIIIDSEENVKARFTGITPVNTLKNALVAQ